MRRHVGLALLVACGFQPSPAAPIGGTDAGLNTLPDAQSAEPDAIADSPSSSHSDGDSSGSAHRQPLVIAGSQFGSNLIDFPVWIDLEDNDDLAKTARPDGSDIFFTDAGGAPLDYEIQSWVAPTLLAWVRVPQLAQETDTTIYVEYGDVSKAVAQNPPGVFQSGYAAVWHLDDSLASPSIADATGKAPGVASGVSASARVAGQLGRAIAFDGTGAAMIAFSNPLMMANPHTITVWVNQHETMHTSAIIAVGSGAMDESRFLYGRYGGGPNIGYGFYDDDTSNGPSISDSDWKMLAWVFEGVPPVSHLYINGTEMASGSANGSVNTVGAMGLIGYAPEPSYGSDNGMDGAIDELRIATVARDPSWISAEWANQSSPTTFYSLGSAEIAP